MLKVPKQFKDREVLYRRVIIFAALIIMVVLYFEKIGQLVSWIVSICMPFLIGAGLAFVFSIISNGFMKFAVQVLHIKESTFWRALSNVLSIFTVFAIMMTFVFIIFPQIFTSIESFIRTLPHALQQTMTWLNEITKDIPSINHWVKDLQYSMTVNGGIPAWLKDILNWVVSGGANGIFDSVYQVVSSTFSFMFSTFVSIMFSIILLFNKKTFVMESKSLLRAYLSENAYRKTIHVLKLIQKTFTSYIGGTCTECLILGSLVTIGATLLNIPYALLAGVIVAIGALVPMFGALVGALLASLFIVVESPIHALYFLIMFICIQQVEGNFIYPNVVGKSVGFPPMYVIIAVTIGANVAGVLGMIIFIPTCSCLYQLIKEDVVIKLHQNHKVISTAQEE